MRSWRASERTSSWWTVWIVTFAVSLTLKTLHEFAGWPDGGWPTVELIIILLLAAATLGLCVSAGRDFTIRDR